jgi:hypothetical protein
MNNAHSEWALAETGNGNGYGYGYGYGGGYGVEEQHD